MPEMHPAVAKAMRAASTPSLESMPEPSGVTPETSGDQEWGHSVPLRTRKETLERFGLDPNGRHNTRDVAQALETRQRQTVGATARDDYSPEAEDKIARWMAEEVHHEMKTPKNSGAGWYTKKFQRALDVFGQVHPELARGSKTALELPDGRRIPPKEARHLLTSLIAITSDGQKVQGNFEQALDAYGNFKKTGRFTTTRGHMRQDSVEANLAKIQDMFDTMGARGMRNHLLQEASVSELKKRAKAAGVPFSSNYKADVNLPMAALVFGPKLGAFYANLMGAHGYLTMDRWWSRTFNRYRGHLLTQPTRAGLDRFKQLVTNHQRLNQPAAMMSDEDALERTKPYRNAYADRGFKNGSEIEKAANTLHKAAFENTEDRPWTASDRTFMLNTANKAQQLLADRGIKMPISDIQAVLWYYEKRLYGGLGARDSGDVSYEDAARNVARALTSPPAQPGGGNRRRRSAAPALPETALGEGEGDHPGGAPAPGSPGRRRYGGLASFADGGEVADPDAPPNPVNTETQSRVGNVRFDQRDGAGSVPNNQNINYLGFTAMMKPSKFLSLSHKLESPRPGHIEGLAQHLADGNAIGSPFLRVDTAEGEDDPEGTFGKVRQHDGRHRMRAIQALQGDTPVPVHIFGSHGDRARHLTPEQIAKLRARMTVQGSSSRESNDNFDDAFHLGKVLPRGGPQIVHAKGRKPFKPVFIHGGRDFDQLDFSKLGSGEPGGIRPLGKGFYGAVARSPQELKNAIALAKVYGDKYGGHLHAFDLDAPEPHKTAMMGYGMSPQWWARGGAGPEVGHRRPGGGQYRALEMEALPHGEFGGGHGPQKIEAAVHDPSLLSRIGKWSADEDPAKIEADIMAARQGRPARAGGGGFPHATKPHLFHSNLHGHHLHVGPIHSSVHGRTDHLPMHVPSGSFVLPADVVSAHGEGNTMAGFKVMKRLFGGAPYGGGDGPYGQGGGPYGEALQNSRGGRAEDGGGPGVPIVAAGGEYVLSPAQVRAVGNGDPEVGCKVLDRFVLQTRAKHIKTLQKLPGPAKD